MAVFDRAYIIVAIIFFAIPVWEIIDTIVNNYQAREMWLKIAESKEAPLEESNEYAEFFKPEFAKKTADDIKLFDLVRITRVFSPLFFLVFSRHLLEWVFTGKTSLRPYQISTYRSKRGS